MRYSKESVDSLVQYLMNYESTSENLTITQVARNFYVSRSFVRSVVADLGLSITFAKSKGRCAEDSLVYNWKSKLRPGEDFAPDDFIWGWYNKKIQQDKAFAKGQ
ncbi:hypothetical protein D3C71_1141330 [compost metagenome]